MMVNMAYCHNKLPNFSIILLVVVFVEGGLSCFLVEVVDSLVCCCLEGECEGFRICRLMTPTCKWRTEAKDGVLDKYEDPEYPGFMFVNEVFGIT